MRKKQIMGILLTAGLLFITGCGGIVSNNTAEESGQTEESQKTEEDGTKEELVIEAEMPEKEEKDLGLDENLGQPGDENLFGEGNTFTWEEITISIPDFWEGKYQIEQDADGFSLIQTASYEKEEGMGFICGFFRSDRMVLDEAGVMPLAYTDTQSYYLTCPTDVCFYYEDEQIAAEYREMSETIEAIAKTMAIDKEGVHYNPDEFILPLSNTILIKEEELLGFSDNELSIARNEIYARHGRQFDSAYLQNYFETCSWYMGTIPAKEFDEAVFSQIEKDNLQILKKAEETYKKEHPYPKECIVGNKIKEDLNGDGKAEEIRYNLKKTGEQGAYSGSLVIDSEEYKLEHYDIILEDPVEDVFYITDIDDGLDETKSLEIAILDNGPSDDPITHFFAYEEGLFYIGSVPGFPFKQQSGYDGFTGVMSVKGMVCLDFPHTCYGYGYWNYDLENKKLLEDESTWYELAPESPHQLYEDLTVCHDADENSMKSIISAQEKVFFMEVWMEDEKDGKSGWILVKGKDGSKGYIHVVDGKVMGLGYSEDKELGEIFSDIRFSG